MDSTKDSGQHYADLICWRERMIERAAVQLSWRALVRQIRRARAI